MEIGWLVIFLTLPIMLNAAGWIAESRSPNPPANARLFAGLGWAQLACGAVTGILGTVLLLRAGH